MKKLFITLAVIVSLSSCAVFNDLKSHCQFTDVNYQDSVSVCLKCDTSAKSLIELSVKNLKDLKTK